MAAGRCDAAQQRGDPRGQLLRAERLGDVVVGAELEARDAIGFFAARRQHDDRDRRGRRIGAQRLADPQAVQPRQHQIEDDEIDRLAPQPRQHVAARRRRLDRVPRACQVMRDQLGDVGVVFDDENAGHGLNDDH